MSIITLKNKEMPRYNEDPKKVVKAIRKDEKGTGIRSKYPQYYLWIEDELWLFGYLSYLNLPCRFADSPYVVNEKVSEKLDALGIDYTVQSIYATGGGSEAHRLFRSGSVETVYQALLYNEMLLINNGRLEKSRFGELDTEVIKNYYKVQSLKEFNLWSMPEIR